MELTLLAYKSAVHTLFFIGIALIALPIIFFVLKAKKVIRPPLMTQRIFRIAIVIGIIMEFVPIYYAYLDSEHGISKYSKSDVLYVAAMNDNEKYVKVMLKKGANPSAVTRFGQTTVYAVAEKDNIPLMQLLISWGADPNASAARYTPLGIACRNGSMEMVRLLVNAGADPEYERTKFPSSLSVAAAYDEGYNYELVKLLCDAGADKSAVSTDKTGKLWLPFKYYFHKAWQTELTGEDAENYEKISELLKESYVMWVWQRHNPDYVDQNAKEES